MDLYKYIALMTVLLVLSGMGALFNNETKTFADYLAYETEDQIQSQMRASANTITDDETALTPQNENTQSEGTGGVGVTQTAIRVWETIRLVIRGANEQAYEADVAAQNATGMNQIFWWSIVFLWTLLTGYGALKIYAWFKNKDTT